MDISNPRRILVVGAPDSGALSLLRDLTGSVPTLLDDSTAGLSHAWHVSTPYYTARIPIWLDEISDVAAWRAEFTKPEAKEVVGALGAWVYCFRKPVLRGELDDVEETLKAIAAAINRAWGYRWDGACLAVATAQRTTPHLQRSVEDWEELCRRHGFEYIDGEAKGRNEFGEKVGVQRVKEALETNDWAAEEDHEQLDFEELGLDDEDDGHSATGGTVGSFAAEEAELNMEFAGLKTAVNAGGDDEEQEEIQVEELERMMLRLQAIKDTGAAMSVEDRKRFAAKAVNGLMKDI